MWYGSRVSRQGRSRPCRRYQASSRRRNQRRAVGIGKGQGRRASRHGAIIGRSRQRDHRTAPWQILQLPHLHQDRRRRRHRAVRRHARVEGRPAGRRLRRRRRAVGLARPGARPSDARRTWPTLVDDIQRDLFAVGAQLADPRHRIAARVEKSRARAGTRRALERAIDRARGAAAAAAAVHPGRRDAGRRRAAPGARRLPARRAARRRARRRMPSTPIVVVYLNRLSDLLFVMARAANARAGVPEIEW